jgi:hypothetical protein
MDEPTNPEARAPLHPEVLRHAEEYADACRHYKRPADVIAAAEELEEFARGGGR